MTTQPSTVTAPATDLPAVLKTGLSPNGAGSPNGSPSHAPSSRPARPRRASRWRGYLFGGLLLAVAAAGVAGYALTAGPKGPRADLILYKVHYEPLNLTVV